MVSNSDYLDPDGFSSPIRQEPRPKWKVFKERVEPRLKPQWCVWDEYYGEYLFNTGSEALQFVHQELSKRYFAEVILQRQEQLNEGMARTRSLPGNSNRAFLLREVSSGSRVRG